MVISLLHNIQEVLLTKCQVGGPSLKINIDGLHGRSKHILKFQIRQLSARHRNSWGSREKFGARKLQALIPLKCLMFESSGSKNYVEPKSSSSIKNQGLTNSEPGLAILQAGLFHRTASHRRM